MGVSPPEHPLEPDPVLALPHRHPGHGAVVEAALDHLAVLGVEPHALPGHLSAATLLSHVTLVTSSLASPTEAALVLGPVLPIHHAVPVVLAPHEAAVVGEDPVLVVELALAGPAVAVHRPLEVGAVPVMVGQH